MNIICMNKFNVIYLPYGFCKELRRICPCETDPSCTINKDYALCSKFEKKGSARAIEEIDGDGKRRVYFASTQVAKPCPREDWKNSDNPQGQKLLGDRIGWQKIKGAVRS
jgi:hypothetical protein